MALPHISLSVWFIGCDPKPVTGSGVSVKVKHLRKGRSGVTGRASGHPCNFVLNWWAQGVESGPCDGPRHALGWGSLGLCHIHVQSSSINLAVATGTLQRDLQFTVKTSLAFWLWQPVLPKQNRDSL